MDRIEICTKQLYEYGIYIYRSFLDLWNIKANANNDHIYTILHTIKDSEDDSSSNSENNDDTKTNFSNLSDSWQCIICLTFNMKEHEQCAKCKIDINTIPILKDLIEDLYNELDNCTNIPDIITDNKILDNARNSLSLTNSPNTTTINKLDDITTTVSRVKSELSLDLTDWDYIDTEIVDQALNK